MPFLNQIAEHINGVLKAGSLKGEKLQPAEFYGIVSIMARQRALGSTGGTIETLPAIVTGQRFIPIAPNAKKALQVYHRLTGNTYAKLAKSYGDGYDIRCTSDVSMVVFINTKLTGITYDVLEPVLIFGIPQKPAAAVLTSLGVNRCSITPLASVTDQIQCWRQEYPQSDYPLNEQMSMVIIKYRVEMDFTQACMASCIC